MKRTTTIVTLSAIFLASSVLAIGNSIAFKYQGQIDLFLSKDSYNYDKDKVNDALTLGTDLAEEICQNGNVLLKNENVLPLEPVDNSFRANIFGWGGSDAGFMYQGGGSSEGGYADAKVSLYNAFRNYGFELNETLVRKYSSLSYHREGSPDQNQHSTYYRNYEPDASFYSEEVMQEAKEFSDVAIVVLSRRATEGDDLPKVNYNENGVADTSRNYLALSQREELMFEEVYKYFDNVIVLVNSSSPMEMGFLNNPKIGAALYVGYPGYYGAAAIPQILTGEVIPSGHLTDTAAYDLTSAPSFVNSGPDATIGYTGKGGRYKDYAEGIYVGYKWYETADAEGYWDSSTYNEYGLNKTGYDAVVQYPFGYGLSYTKFNWLLQSVTDSSGKEISQSTTLKADDSIHFKVWVENVGEYDGKDVVELYYSAPYKKGEIEKSSVNLIGFQKTSLLQPGQGQTLEFQVNVSDMASYDAYDKNNNGFMGYELDGGNYSLSFRTDAHNVKDDLDGREMSYKYQIPSEGYKIENDPVTGHKVENRFTTYLNTISGAESQCYEPQSLYMMSIDGNDADPDYNQGIRYLTRGDFKNTFPKRTSTRSMSQKMFDMVFKVHDPINNGNDVMPKFNSKDTSWTIDDVKGLPYDDPKWDELISQLSIEQLATLCARGGFGTISIPEINKGKCTDSDGGTGFTSGIATGDSGHATKYPAANIIASTWDWKIAYKWGHAIGEEGKALNIQGWYAPGCNVHRSPLGGRNFEYFSEDGLLCGEFVAQTVKGCTENGVYAYMKHFAGNDTDEGRNGQFIWMQEQALREIWAKPGEVATKVGKANAMMVSVDRVGGTRATGSYALLTSLLRDEWGFRGSAITDYYQSGNVNDLDEGIRAGNDLALLPGGDPNALIQDYRNPSATTVIALQKSAHNILYTYIDTIDRTEKFTGIDLNQTVGQRREDTSGTWWRPLLYTIDAVLATGFVVWGGLAIYLTWFKKRKKD